MKKQNGLIAAALAAALSAPVYAADVTLSGLVEVEASTAEDFAGAKSTDIIAATAAVAIDAQINDRVAATVAFLYEEDSTDFGLDEGYITLQMNRATSLVAGRLYVPFGYFDSNMVSDPLTLQLGETVESVLMLDMASGNASGSLYTFNGDVDTDEDVANDDNSILSFGANFSYDTDNLHLGASYISNIAESDSLEALGGSVDTAVAGYGVSFGYTLNNFSVIAEHVTAAEKFTNGDFGTVDHDNDPATPEVNVIANEEQPRATNVELAVTLTNGATIAAGYQVASESAFLGLPKYVTSLAVSFEPMRDVALGIEYAAMEDYEVNGGETGSALTAQLAVEF